MKASFVIAFAALFAAASAMPTNGGRPVVPMGHEHGTSQTVGDLGNTGGSQGAANNLLGGGILSNNERKINVDQTIVKDD